MKTAMQEFFEFFESKTSLRIGSDIKKEFLEKEKQQTVDAWENGDMVNHFISGQEYYNETFKQ